MELILWRHADAIPAEPGQSDLARCLSKRGEKQARRVAGWLHEHRPKDLRILVSPAQRTLQTAAALALPFEIDARLGPGAAAADLITASGWPDAAGTVLLVGHQPTLGQLAALLQSGLEADWAIKKGALWWFYWRNGGQTTLRIAITADLVSSA